MHKAVLFDIGETLINFGPLDKAKAFEKAGKLSYQYLKGLGQPVGELQSYVRKNMGRLKRRVLWSNITGRDFDSLKVLMEYGKKTGINLHDGQWEHVHGLWYKPLAEAAWVDEGAAEALEELSRRGYKLGIISNTFVHSAALDEHLETLGLLKFFPIRLYSYQFPFRKPDRRIFLAGAQAVETEPNEVIYVGDRLDKDVKGAGRAGMTTILKRAYTNEGKKIPSDVPVVESIAEIPEKIVSFSL